MTEAQKFHFYFPAWSACVKANGWRKQKGRLVLDASKSSDELAKVVTFGTQRAIMAGRGLATDDLRHGCHIVALGKDKSSEHLTNTELDRVVTLFQVLTDPDNLTPRLKWDAYLRGEDPGAVNRVEYFIRRNPDAYVRAVSHGLFGTRNWEGLTVAQKGRLSMTLANRKPSAPGQSKVQSPKSNVLEPVAAGHDHDPDNEPF